MLALGLIGSSDSDRSPSGLFWAFQASCTAPCAYRIRLTRRRSPSHNLKSRLMAGVSRVRL